MSNELQLTIAHTWDGESIAPHGQVSLCFASHGLRIEVDALDRGDPPPPGPPGPTARLWEHEVVEVFLLGAAQRYLEVELGPHGHYLVLRLHGRRNIVESGLTIDYSVTREGGRWRGVAQVPAALLPPGLSHLNAFAIHGEGSARRYLAWTPLPGPAPDFHRLEGFAPLPARP